MTLTDKPMTPPKLRLANSIILSHRTQSPRNDKLMVAGHVSALYTGRIRKYNNSDNTMSHWVIAMATADPTNPT